MNFLKISLFSIILLSSYNLYSMKNSEESSDKSSSDDDENLAIVFKYVELPTGQRILKYAIDKNNVMHIDLKENSIKSNATKKCLRKLERMISAGATQIEGNPTNGWFSIKGTKIEDKKLIKTLNKFYKDAQELHDARTCCCTVCLIAPALAIFAAIAVYFY